MNEIQQHPSLGTPGQLYPGWYPAPHPLAGPELHTTGTRGPITCTMVAWEGQGGGRDTIYPQVWAVDEAEQEGGAAEEVERAWAEPLPPSIPWGFLEY